MPEALNPVPVSIPDRLAAIRDGLRPEADGRGIGALVAKMLLCFIEALIEIVAGIDLTADAPQAEPPAPPSAGTAPRGPTPTAPRRPRHPAAPARPAASDIIDSEPAPDAQAFTGCAEPAEAPAASPPPSSHRAHPRAARTVTPDHENFAPAPRPGSARPNCSD